MKKIFFLILITCFALTGCMGGVTCYLHDCHRTDNPLPTVELKLGEKTKAVKDVRGYFPGGYLWGFIAVDPSIVKIEYERKGRKIDIYLTGIKEGKTKVYYVNHLVFEDPGKSIDDYGLTGKYYKEKDSQYFILDVVK